MSKTSREGNTAARGLPFIQPRLTIHEAGDTYEQQADAMADTVMRMKNPLDRTATGTDRFFKPDPVTARAVQRKCAQCEEKENAVQRKGTSGQQASADSGLETYIGSLNGGGQALPDEVRSFYEPRFGYDFSQVRVHTDTVAAKSAESINALAYTSGSNIVFNSGQYSPDTDGGRQLLAHELTHVMQQSGGKQAVQKAPLPDTGFRYTPPATVKRSIMEIQAVVGVTPDGVYGINTKNAVETYQKKLKSLGLYNDTIDGKWGKNTDDAHVLFATGNLAETYNCSGLAFKTYIFTGMPVTKAILAGMTKLASCSDKCKPYQYKFFFWEYDVSLTDLTTGVTGPANRDFHIVGGQTDSKGEGPSQAVSKNGKRPVEGPKPPKNWFPVSEMARENNHTNKIVPNVFKNRTNHVETCFCSDKLP